MLIFGQEILCFLGPLDSLDPMCPMIFWTPCVTEIPKLSGTQGPGIRRDQGAYEPLPHALWTPGFIGHPRSTQLICVLKDDWLFPTHSISSIPIILSVVN